MIGGTGWTLAYIRKNITIPQARGLFHYWSTVCRPAQESLTALVGAFAAQKDTQGQPTPAERRGFADPDKLDPLAPAQPNYEKGSSQDAIRMFQGVMQKEEFHGTVGQPN